MAKPTPAQLAVCKRIIAWCKPRADALLPGVLKFDSERATTQERQDYGNWSMYDKAASNANMVLLYNSDACYNDAREYTHYTDFPREQLEEDYRDTTA